MQTEIIAKATGTTTTASGDVIELTVPSVVRLDLDRSRVAAMERQGDDLILRLTDGQTIRIDHFYATQQGMVSDLVLRDDRGGQWLAHPAASGTGRFTPLSDIDELIGAGHGDGGASGFILPAVLGVAGVGGLVAAVSGGGGKDRTPDATADTQPPAQPTASFTARGESVSGTGEAGATVRVTDPAGNVIGTGTVGADGRFTVPVNPPQANGQPVTVTQTDAAGNVSPAATATAPDITPPAAPVATLNEQGTTITGTGEPGATVTVRDATGQSLGTSIVGAGGTYTLSLTTPQANGGTLTVTQSDPAGNISPAITLTAPDITPPAAPTATITGDGTGITGTGEPGATVTVRDATGQSLGTAIVGAGGTYTLSLTTPQTDGGTLIVSQSDPAGNASPPMSLTTPDMTAPDAPTATIAADGASITGTGEPGATVTVRDATGQALGTATVGTDGNYTVPLTSPQANGGTLTVSQSDPAGNISPTTTVTAPDTTAPAAPTATIAADGATITGTGEPGATVTVRDTTGQLLGTATVGTDGSYSVPLTSPQANGGTLSVSQSDPAGNASPTTTVTAPDTTAPAAPTATIAADGTSVSGTGEPGATVTVRDAAGQPLGTATVGTNGSYSVPLTSPQANGGTLSVSQSDPAGNASPATTVTAPDTTAPAAPTATIAADGTSITGTGEPGATVTVRDATGQPLGTATVGTDGSYSVSLASPQANGGTLTVSQSDPAGNISPATTVTAPDTTAPAAPTATIAADGTSVSGTGEPGATVTVRDATGQPLGSATVGTDGSYSVPLASPQANGGTLSVSQSDPAGNASPATTVTAPDTTAPAAPTATIAADGTSITGTGEPGATVTVRDAIGQPLGTATVGSDGSYSVPLTSPQANGGTLTVSQSDSAGNISPATTVTARDTTAPAAPTATIAADGTSITGTGEPGATVTVRDATGQPLGTATVGTDGNYSVPLSSPQANGGTLSVSQSDPAGNTSPATSVTAPDITPPAAPLATVSADGTSLIGSGEVGATVTVRDAAGQPVGTATVGSDGGFSVALPGGIANGQTLSVVQSDAAGNVSPATATVTPDLVAPAAPTATLAPGGTSLSGTGEPGATVEIRDAAGTVIGRATVDPQGAFTAPLATPQANGETLIVSQTDAAGNVSPAITVTAPDTTAPDAPIATLSSDGASVYGNGEPGATVRVVDAGGTTLGSAVVGSDGLFVVTLATPQTNGQILSADQSDAAGNVSPPSIVAAPDVTAPDAPVATISVDGSVVSGTGEPFATVTVRGPGGVVIGSAQVDANGSYAATLTPPQANGEVLSLDQADRGGNVSASTSLTAPDITAPTGLTAAISGDGTIVSGQAEAGATVTIRDPSGQVIGTGTAGATGAYAVTLTTAQVNGEVLQATQADAAGNVSAPSPAIAPDITPPAAPLIALDATGANAIGTGEVGATVTLRDAGGTVIGTGVVEADGRFAVPLTPAQANGGTVTATLTDAAGNVSPVVTVFAPDITPPVAPIAALDATGTIVSGTGEAGATVTVRDANGAVLGSALVGTQGGYAVTLSAAQLDSQVLSVTQADAAGNGSPATSIVALDRTPPAAPLGSVSGDGATLTGTGEVGAVVTVTDPVGLVLATVPVGADGSFGVTLSPPLTNGQILTLTQADAAGNVSAPGNATAPDLIPNDTPLAPTATVAADGASVSGTGQAGTAITVRDADGTIIGTGIVAGDGSYTATLTTPQRNGEIVRVTQTDAEGDVSPPATATAPDLTPPALPAATIDATGTVVSGTGEVGATVRVLDASGTQLGSATVGAGGSYAVVLPTAQINGQALSVVQADVAGNTSPAAPLTAPDLTAPLAPTGLVAGDGTSLSGTGEVGATVTIRDPGGAVIGSALVGADGIFTAPLTPAQANGQALTLTQADAAGNVSAVAQATAPDITAPTGLTAAINGVGTLVSGTGEAGATVTVRDALGNAIGTATVAANGSYAVTLTTAQANGQALTVIQADAAGNASPPSPLTAPDITPPAAPVALVNGTGTVVTGTGEAGATVRILDPLGQQVGSAVVGSDGGYSATLTTPQANGQALTVTQVDAAGNISAPTPLSAPDITPPAPPTAAINATGTIVTGTGEVGASVEVRNAAGTVIGTGTVATGGIYAVTLTPPQVAGETLNIGLRDGAGNASTTVSITAPFDISAFDNAASATVDLLPVQTNETLGNANYTALVSLGLINLDAQVLAIPNVQFTVQPGHTLDATFTYNATLSLGVASGYSVVVQRLDGTNWVAVEGSGNSSLLEVRLLNGNLVANADLGPGQYRAFVTFDNTLGIGLLGGLSVAGVNSDFTDIGQVVAGATIGNVITDPGPTGQVDVVSPQTRVESVTLNGVTTAITADDTVVIGQWGTLTIDRDGSYSYTPNADAAVIGKVDRFSYTLLDASDGERESATLAITIGSPDVTGAPVAVNDVATANATFVNQVETRAPAVDTTFPTPTAGLFTGPQTARITDSFTVDANSVSNVTLTAAIAPGLSVLPSYTITVTNAAGAVVGTASGTALAGVGGLVGSGISVTMNGLPSGTYNYTITSTNPLGASFTTSVYVAETVTHLDRFTFTGATPVSGELLANDTLGSPFLGIKVLVGGSFVDVGDAGQTLTGAHGTLTIDEVGRYTYQPTTPVAYAATDPIDSFTYQIVQPDGQVSTARLDVAIDIANNGVAPAFPTATITALSADDAVTLHADVVPMTLMAADHPVATADHADARLALSLMEGQGSVEDVLSRYLDALGPDTGAGTGLAANVELHANPVVTDPIATPDLPLDPLGYLTVSVDPEHEKPVMLHTI
ncbi:BapA/Bap/LapF family large adhesin [uncultured Sphingomonas sp.]|uniref:BapA/Bap/LapF family large adhesin n=1 Tax=uncultured Sphingomonas sp. TaxID=158754 RepID=UPI0025CCC9A4|nr:BapA/Bap/LapF family large adhesin [uncultured Sphingomonas sp.]